MTFNEVVEELKLKGEIKNLKLKENEVRSLRSRGALVVGVMYNMQYP